MGISWLRRIKQELTISLPDLLNHHWVWPCAGGTISTWLETRGVFNFCLSRVDIIDFPGTSLNLLSSVSYLRDQLWSHLLLTWALPRMPEASLFSCILLSHSLPAKYILAGHGRHHSSSCLQNKTTFPTPKILFNIHGLCKLLSIFKKSITQKNEEPLHWYCIRVYRKMKLNEARSAWFIRAGWRKCSFNPLREVSQDWSGLLQI